MENKLKKKKKIANYIELGAMITYRNQSFRRI